MATTRLAKDDPARSSRAAGANNPVEAALQAGLWRGDAGGRRGGAWRVAFAGIWLLYLIPAVAPAFRHPHSWLYSAGAVVLVLAFATVYVVVVGWWDHVGRRTMPMIALLFALAALGCGVYGSGAASVWIYVSVAVGMVGGPQKVTLRAIAAVVACYVFFSYVSVTGRASTGDFLSALLPLVFGGFMALAFRARIEVTRELIRARETVALLAASEERLRLARDMHDLTGQSLSVITLKSQLAAKLLDQLPPSAEQARARDEVAQVADVSRQALADIREAISGYRRPTLAVEAITGRAALEAAGITVHDASGLTLLSGTFDPDAEAALAWCMREAVTNVVRHSGARNCWLTLQRRRGDLVLEVRDDGRGVAAGSPGTAGPLDAGAGHAGLHGMAERLSAVGGRLEIRPGGSPAGGFCLVATVPAGERVPGGGPGLAYQPTAGGSAGD